MNSADRLRRLFDFDAWSNREILVVFKDYKSFEHQEKAMSLFSHIIAVQDLWYRRITGADLAGLEVWPGYPLSECQDKIKRFSSHWKRIIDENEEDLDRIISYKNTSGVAYETMLSDILHHVVIHGQHHRAQIASVLRESGIKPPPTDFIFYTRETKIEF